ncbi:Conserved oligomeric Golgi complex subunit 8 [Hypsizygus marmoreus]|uniref:Conserved oligomeric Golgi complex subunit 8 n=1 Tax=Hypsizygus marmoreus TaxID=39966 RepID=A0A369K195_HYPMA|nr:Conserved oligomeric Golgi complex subunit 8 [Hypsizygus marmoreus]
MTMAESPSSSSAAAYETHLTTLDLPALLAEPSALQTQAHHLTSSLTSLTHTSYPTFLTLHQTTNGLSSSLGSLSTSLSSLISTSLPALQEATAAWHTRTTDVLHERSKARLVLDQHDKLKDLLDIPLFIDSCVRNGYFQEALALASHVSAMATRPNAPTILISVHAEVRVAIAQMLVVLLGTLHEPGRKLPALWKAVNFLRKMNAFGRDEEEDGKGYLGCVVADEGLSKASSEELLALAFLSGRLTCLTAALDPISRDINRLINAPTSSPTDYSASTPIDNPKPTFNLGSGMSERDKEDVARYLKKYIDVWRESAYDLITQYSTIFLEQQQPSQLTSPPPKSTASFQRRPSGQSAHPPPIATSAPLPSPAPSLLPLLSPHLLSHLLPLLRTTLPLLPLPFLPSLLTQLTYCATAFTRVGLDFRGVVGGVVSDAVVSAVRRGFRDIKSITSPDKGKPVTSKKPSEWLILSSHIDSPPLPHAVQTPAHIPPQLLTSYPPLAKYTNTVLGVLNSLRLLAPVGIMRDLVVELDGVLGGCGAELIEYLGPFVGVGGSEDEEEEGGDEERGRRAEEKVARAVGDVYFKVLVPFLRRALVEGVYGVPIASLGDGGEDMLGRTAKEWEER